MWRRGGPRGRGSARPDGTLARIVAFNRGGFYACALYTAVVLLLIILASGDAEDVRFIAVAISIPSGVVLGLANAVFTGALPWWLDTYFTTYAMNMALIYCVADFLNPDRKRRR